MYVDGGHTTIKGFMTNYTRSSLLLNIKFLCREVSNMRKLIPNEYTLHFFLDRYLANRYIATSAQQYHVDYISMSLIHWYHIKIIELMSKIFSDSCLAKSRTA